MRAFHLCEFAAAESTSGPFQLLVIPNEALTPSAVADNPALLPETLGLTPLRAISSPAHLPRAIQTLLSRPDPVALARRLREEPTVDVADAGPDAVLETVPETAALAERIVFAEVIPFRESPRSCQALVSARDLCLKPDAHAGICAINGTPVLTLASRAGLAVGAATEDIEGLLAGGLARLTGD